MLYWGPYQCSKKIADGPINILLQRKRKSCDCILVCIPIDSSSGYEIPCNSGVTYFQCWVRVLIELAYLCENSQIVQLSESSTCCSLILVLEVSCVCSSRKLVALASNASWCKMFGHSLYTVAPRVSFHIDKTNVGLGMIFKIILIFNT